MKQLYVVAIQRVSCVLKLLFICTGVKRNVNPAEKGVHRNETVWLFHPPVGYSLIYPTTWISRLKTRLVTVHP